MLNLLPVHFFLKAGGPDPNFIWSKEIMVDSLFQAGKAQNDTRNDLFIKSQAFKGHADSISALVCDDSHGVLYTSSLDNTIRVSSE